MMNDSSEEEKTIEMRVVVFVLKGKQEICMCHLTDLGAEVYRELSYLENDIRTLRSGVDHLNGWKTLWQLLRFNQENASQRARHF